MEDASQPPQRRSGLRHRGDGDKHQNDGRRRGSAEEESAAEVDNNNTSCCRGDDPAAIQAGTKARFPAASQDLVLPCGSCSCSSEALQGARGAK